MGCAGSTREGRRRAIRRYRGLVDFRRRRVSITPRTGDAEAERFVVAHAGKPSDGMHSRFNRYLCRPLVRLLTHTPVTPNMVTLGGLAAGILAGLSYAWGF